jgi:hypothetical protein
MPPLFAKAVPCAEKSHANNALKPYVTCFGRAMGAQVAKWRRDLSLADVGFRRSEITCLKKQGFFYR